jgi:cytoskeletal protein CcmA (bactofilin family)
MGMFAQNSKSGKNGARRSSAPISTIIATGSVIDGTLNSEGAIRIDGRVCGGIEARDAVVIGETGFVEGDISAPEIAIAGELHGNAIASSLVELMPTGRLHGDATAPRIAMSEEAFVCGRCVTCSGEPGAQPLLSAMPEDGTIVAEGAEALA